MPLCRSECLGRLIKLGQDHTDCFVCSLPLPKHTDEGFKLVEQFWSYYFYETDAWFTVVDLFYNGNAHLIVKLIIKDFIVEALHAYSSSPTSMSVPSLKVKITF